MRAGELLRFYRKRLGMSQLFVAEVYGVTERTIRNWESQEREPGFNDVVTIVEKIFKVPLDQAWEELRDDQAKYKAAA
ncbi:helix-turn-helix transcriptional regulator [Algicola sagamiensis]|uniref:helix-turn-helix transcriptional regulator n=1 Tax=Algicola sagamiensis TaxID=163869 RepID=UPI0009FDA490|nr:helix-turn-helix transcriptional regulator [Algicola sagamiensis]